MPKDACYSKVKSSYAVFPSARASQAIAKTKYELTPSKLAAKKAEKSKVGMGRRVKNI